MPRGKTSRCVILGGIFLAKTHSSENMLVKNFMQAPVGKIAWGASENVRSAVR